MERSYFGRVCKTMTKITGKTSDISWSVIDAYNPLNRGDEDWQSLMYRTAYEKQVGLSVLGGNESLRYSVNASYLDQDGVLLGSNYKRITARANTEYDMTKFLKIGTNVSYVHGINDRVALRVWVISLWLWLLLHVRLLIH